MQDGKGENHKSLVEIPRLKRNLILLFPNDLAYNKKKLGERIIRSHLNRKQKSHFNEVGFRFVVPFLFSSTTLYPFDKQQITKNELLLIPQR